MKKKPKHLYKLLLLLTVIGAFMSCSSSDNGGEDLTLTVSATEINFEAKGGTDKIEITTNDTWILTNTTSWIQTDQTTGGSGTLVITATRNSSDLSRFEVLSVVLSDGTVRQITVKQPGSLYPDYNTDPIPADASGMSSNAVELAAKINLGWNIGNTLEAPGGENGWGNPNITNEYVAAIKSLGFNAVRLPCSWDGHADEETAKIDQEWMDRVKEVVQYCVDNDMYVLLNIHWDGGWLENNCIPDEKDSVNEKQRAYWEQIATAMRDFDEHLMFASANEPAVEDAAQMEVLASYHQTFVNAVRSTGGKNSYRVLVVQGPGTNIEKSNDLMDMPEDEIEGRLMAEVHFYSPSQFCFLKEDVDWGKMAFYWGNGFHSTIEPDRNATYGEEDAVDASMALAKAKFVDNGVPVIMGEYGAYRRDNDQFVPMELDLHNDSVDYWLTYVTKKALDNGLIPFYWDIGEAVDRQDYTVKDQRSIDAIIAGSN